MPIRDLLRFAFENDGHGLDGPIGLKPPKIRGKLRPGRRSTELALTTTQRKLAGAKLDKAIQQITTDARNWQRQLGGAKLDKAIQQITTDARNWQRQAGGGAAIVRPVRSSPSQRSLSPGRGAALTRRDTSGQRRAPVPLGVGRRVIERTAQRRAPMPRGLLAGLLGDPLGGPLPPGYDDPAQMFQSGDAGDAGDAGDEQAITNTPTGPELGNGFVWVTETAVPLQWPMYFLDDRGGRPSLTWPDGTPARSRIWLPAVNMADFFDPVQYARGVNPWLAEWRNSVQRYASESTWGGGWSDSQAASEAWGGRAWSYVIPGWCRPGGVGAQAGNPNPPAWPGLAWREEIAHGRGYAAQDKCGTLRSLFASFDWSKENPTIRAYPWLYLNVANGAEWITWRKMPADLYRYDLQPGDPTRLPPLAWLALDFLDAIQTGAHGFPILVKTGAGGGKVLDHAALSAFLQTPEGAAWAPLILDPRGDSMLAIIYDVDRVAPELVPDDGSRTWDPQLDREAAADEEALDEEAPPAEDPYAEDPYAADPYAADPYDPSDPEGEGDLYFDLDAPGEELLEEEAGAEWLEDLEDLEGEEELELEGEELDADPFEELAEEDELDEDLETF